MSQLSQLTGLDWLIPCFLIKLLLCLYEKVGCPVCRDLGCSKEDLGRRARRPCYDKHNNNFVRKQGMSRTSPVK